MKTQWLIVALAAWLVPVAAATAQDAIKKVDDTTITCTVTKVGKTAVEYEERSAPKSIAVNEIDHIIYSGEPSTVRTARSHVLSGRYNDAMEQIGRINAADVTRKEVQQDLDFYKVFCQAQLALGGEGQIAEAGRDMVGFINSNSDSYHYLQALEVVGDLLVANRAYEPAATFYTKLGQEAPWPDYKMRAGVAVGRSLLAQNKPQEALKEFEKVLATQADGAMAEKQKAAATLGKARCLAETGQVPQAIEMIEAMIAKTDPESGDLLAQAYNALGTALRKSNDTKAALLAFLHVDVLYFTNRMAHAEALANLAVLWNEVHQTERAMEARQLLQDRYKNSPWAQQ